MVTSLIDFLRNLQNIKDNNLPYNPLPLPPGETIYDVDLNSRTIKAPKYLSMEYDHESEIIFFRTDRYYDNVDLSDMTCIIQYRNKNAKKDDGITPDGGYAYLVTTYVQDNSDIEDEIEKKNSKILIPWPIGGAATKAAGDVEFAIRFFKVTEIQDPDNPDKKIGRLLYNLNTKVATSKILHGMDNILTVESDKNYQIETNAIEQIFAQIKEISEKRPLSWIELYDTSDKNDTIDLDYYDTTLSN